MTGEDVRGDSGRVLVTGAAGFAGGHLLDALGSDTPVIAWRHRRQGRSAPPDHAAIQWDAVDLLDAPAVERACAAARPTRVFHLAAAAQVAASWRTVNDTLAVNVRGTHHLLDALSRHAPRARVLIAGSATVYRPSDAPLDEESPVNPVSPYGVSKLAQEMLGLRAWRHQGLAVVVARAFNHIGPRQSADYVASSVARQIALAEIGQAEPRLLVGNLDAERDITDVRDTVRAYMRLAALEGASGRVYNVCRGRAIRVRELIERLLSRARVPMTIAVDPSRLRPVDTPLIVGAPGRLQQETGWTAGTPLDDTLDDLLAWWRSEIAAGRRA